MNLGTNPQSIPSASINLATPLGALLNLQGMTVGENESNPEVSFENVLANASLENEQSVESPSQITPQKVSQTSLEDLAESITVEPESAVSSSSQINRETDVSSPQLAQIHPSIVQEIQPKITLQNALNEVEQPLKLEVAERKTTELPIEVLEAVRNFEIEEEQRSAISPEPLVLATAQQNAPEIQKEIKTEKVEPVVLNNQAIAVNNVVIPVSNNHPVVNKAPKLDNLNKENTSKNSNDQNVSKLVIKTSLPVNSRDIEIIQSGNFLSELDAEYASELSEEKFIARLSNKADDQFVMTERTKDPLPMHRISHYQEKGIPVENRSQNISHQVVKVLNNLETKSQTITVQLDPVDLGKIDIKMDISPKGETKVFILADKLETYALLSKSSDQIRSILTDKGLNQDSTSLNFGLRHGNSNQNNQQQYAWNRQEKEFDESNLEHENIRVASLYYSDLNRLDIKA